MKYRVHVRTYYGNGARPSLWQSPVLRLIGDAIHLRMCLLEDEPRDAIGVDVWLVPA